MTKRNCALLLLPEWELEGEYTFSFSGEER